MSFHPTPCSPPISRTGSRAGSIRSSHSLKSLTSSHSIKSKALPSFIRPTEVLRNSCLWPFAAEQPSPSTAPNSHEVGRRVAPISLRAELRPERKGPIKAKVEFKLDAQALFPNLVEEVLDRGKPGQEPLLRFRGTSLMRSELQALLTDGDVSKSILECYFKIMKDKNRARQRLVVTADRVKLFSGKVSLGVFSQGKAELVHSTKNIFKFE